MNARKLGLPQSVSSAIAEISERTGQRIDGGHHRTNRGAVIKAPARQDPLADVWASELEPMLRREPRLKPTTLFEYLEEAYPGKYQRVLRTLQRLEPSSNGSSEYYEVVSGSIYDGDTLRVSDGTQEIKVRLCGIDAPEKDQALGIESRDHLRSLVSKGNGQIILVRTDTDQYGRTIAEAFIPTGNSEEEIHLNSQMVADGMAYVYPQYVDSCPNAEPMKTAERTAKESAQGVWTSPVGQKPWEYRQRSRR